MKKFHRDLDLLKINHQKVEAKVKKSLIKNHVAIFKARQFFSFLVRDRDKDKDKTFLQDHG